METWDTLNSLEEFWFWFWTASTHIQPKDKSNNNTILTILMESINSVSSWEETHVPRNCNDPDSSSSPRTRGPEGIQWKACGWLLSRLEDPDPLGSGGTEDSPPSPDSAREAWPPATGTRGVNAGGGALRQMVARSQIEWKSNLALSISN